ncbi:MAG: Crp/Fnr family transcriptional regulator [Prevotella sp.]|nr:Crp/Fnr family transcriptional regulator [Prevotella sp.]
MVVLGKETEHSQIIQAIRELWELLTEEQRLFLITHISLKNLKKNEFIYHENDTPEFLYCLAQGKVKIFKEGIGRRSQIVRMVKPEGFFGYRAGFANDRYSTSASAFEAVTVCQIPLSVIMKILHENNDVAIYFIQQLAGLLGHADQQTVNLTQKHIRGRLAEALLQLKNKYGTEENGKTLASNLSREDMASLSNMTTSNAIRTLSAFATENLIAIDGRHITLLDEEKLHKISKNG